MSDKKYDCIIIPGGGLAEDGSLPAWTIARLERALELQDQAEWIITLSGGTVHKPPPLDREGFPVFESRAGAKYLLEAGLDPGRILTEICSYDTIGNAYFARVLFTDPLGLGRIHLITSAFHLPRVQAAFQWIYSLTPIMAEPGLSFEGTPDTGLSPAALKARVARENSSLEKLAEKTKRIETLADFQRWLYSEHAAYSIVWKNECLNEEELKSY